MLYGTPKRFMPVRVLVPVLTLTLLGLAMTLSSCTPKETQPAPPVAKIIPKTDTLHGEVVVDNYFWLRGRSDAGVLLYLEEENAYTSAMMKHTEPLQKTLYDEMVGRIQETDLDVPMKLDDYYYYTRTEEGKQYKYYCRKKGSLDAPEEIVLDHNRLAEGHKFSDMGVYEISPDHKLLAFSMDTTGAEEYTLYVKNIETGEMLSDEIQNTADVEWANDNRTIFYSTLDPAHRPFKLFRHALGSDSKDDALVYHEADDAFFLGLSKTKSQAFLMVSLGSITSSEVRYLDANKPTGEFKVLHPREKDHEYEVTHHGDKFYVTTNADGATNFKLMSVSTRNPAKKNWKEVLPHREDVKLDGAEAFVNHLVVYKREGGFKGIHIMNLKTGDSHDVEWPEPVYSFRGAANPDFNTNLVRFTYNSLVTPKTVYDYNMDTHDKDMKKQYEVLGGYDPSAYESVRLMATASDGTQIPMSVVYRKGMVLNGTNPTYLYGYGSYGSSMDPYFSSNRLSLLDRGFVFAMAHVRGGGEMGRLWYENGKLLKKKNTFTDFIACAEHLIAEKYTSTKNLVISGGSAGGLLMGAVLNMRPDLFKAAVADVPFVDVINTMWDESIPLTVIEFDEWGNPKIEEFYHYMKSYSPYDNVEAKAYPDILITAGLNDPRVQYWEPAKWTAKLRAMKTDNNWLILKTQMGAGHMGASGRYDYLKEIAFEYAFVLDRLGMTQ